jgi:hydroxymethylglutaryl-CoA lyase
MSDASIKLTECPRDAMQGLHEFVPTDVKARYINLLLQVGFDTIDFGSFVSSKAIPQMRDTAEVLAQLDLGNTKSKLLAIIANYRGAEHAAVHEAITYLGYPFSISETFQMRNTNSTMFDSFSTIERIQELCEKKNKKLLVYLSMGFGNPYGDEWSKYILMDWVDHMHSAGIYDVAVSDTIGIATPDQIRDVCSMLKGFDHMPSLHLHSTPDSALEKIAAAFESGIRNFDSALKGYGGCPMAKDDLTGNIATENLISYLKSQNALQELDYGKLQEALDYSVRVFG